MMQLTPIPMEADLHTYGFPPGYFVIRSVATNRALDVASDEVEDGTAVILWPETETSLVETMRRPESNNQVFYIDTSGAFCSRSSGHAIDVENEGLVLRHRRPVSHPFPNAYSHPLPHFSYDRDTKQITVAFSTNPAYPSASSGRAETLSTWKEKTYLLSSMPMRKPRTIIDDATAFMSSALSVPFSLFGSPKGSRATAEDVFGGDIDLREDEILEQERSEEGEVDDSPDKVRWVRVVGLSKEDVIGEGEKAKARRQWDICPLRSSKKSTET